MHNNNKSIEEDSDELAASAPEDARVVAAILKAASIDAFDTRVVAQLVEFVYKYIGDVLECARTYAQYGEREEINQEDVKLAVSSLLSKSFTQPPSRDVLLELCRERNQIPLPPIESYVGIQLPPPQFQLTRRNYQLPRKMSEVRIAQESLKSFSNAEKPEKELHETTPSRMNMDE
eukprot:jgi/Galph1/4349/GphlegSOOS_G3024.1